MSVSASSTDGVNWTVSESLPVIWESICYADSPCFRSMYSAPVFVAVCCVDDVDTIAISTDGVKWIFTPMNVASDSPDMITYTTGMDTLTSVARKNVICKRSPIMYCSPDANTNGRFIIVTQHKVMTSIDAINWTIIDTSECNSKELGEWKPIGFTYGRIGDRNCYVFTNTYGSSNAAYITIAPDFRDWVTYPLVSSESGECVMADNIRLASMCCGSGKLICLCPYRSIYGYRIVMSDVSTTPTVNICRMNRRSTAIVYGPSASGKDVFAAVFDGSTFSFWEDGSPSSAYNTPFVMLKSICQSPKHDGSYIIMSDMDRDSKVLMVTTDYSQRFETIKVGNGQKWKMGCEGGGRVVIISAEMDGSYGKSDDETKAFIVTISEPVAVGDFVTSTGVRIEDQDVNGYREKGMVVYVVQSLLPGSHAIVRMAR